VVATEYRGLYGCMRVTKKDGVLRKGGWTRMEVYNRSPSGVYNAMVTMNLDRKHPRGT
jgi:hypothetical protein